MRVPLKGVSSATKRLADGSKVRYYYAWRGGPRLEGEFGSPEFHASYRDAVARKPKKGDATLANILDAYRDSDWFRKLAQRTAKDYARILDTIAAKFGDMPVNLLEAREVRGDFLEWRDELAKTSLRGADYTFAVFARAFAWAHDRRKISSNPLTKKGKVWSGSRAENVWTDDDETRFKAVASRPMVLALMLAVWTGQRQGDLLKLEWSAYDGKFIRLQQSKTGARVMIPVGKPLKALLDETKRDGATIILSSDDQPYTSDGFRATWRKACAKAGIKGVTFHDLRGTAVTRLAIAGAGENEIATITGHKVNAVRSILDTHYLNRDPAMAVNAIRRLERRVKK